MLKLAFSFLLICFVGLFAKLFCQSKNANAKTKTQQINFTTLLSEMIKERRGFSNIASSSILLQNLSIRFDTLDRLGMDKRFKESGEILYVNHDLSLINIDFDETYWLVARNIHFKGFFKIQTCKNVKMIFKDCIFDKNTKINANEANFLKFENCQFRHGFMYQFNNLSEYITFENCTFSIDMAIKEDKRFSVFNTFDIEHHLFDFSNKTEPFDLNFIACKFLIPEYNRLIGCYSTFYQIFKSQGNRFYANNSYVEWKNIETNYLNHVYKQNNDSQIYFIYLMNLFLRDFCSYGTDPLESIYLSGVVILLFGFSYFFIPSPINSTRINSIRNIQRYLQVFKTNFVDNNTPNSEVFDSNHQIMIQKAIPITMF